MPPTIVQPAIASGERLKPRELDIRLEPLPPALTAHGALGGIREHGGDLGTPHPRLFLARHRDVLRHASPERAVANVDRREDRESDQRENRDDHEDHQPRRRDDVVDPGRLEGPLRGEVEGRGRVLGRCRRQARNLHEDDGLLQGRKQRAVGELVLARELLPDLLVDLLKCGGVVCFDVRPVCALRERLERLRRELIGLESDRDDTDVGFLQRGCRASGEAGRARVVVRAVGQEYDCRSLESLILRLVRGFDESVVDVGALGRGGRLRDGRRRDPPCSW